MPSPLRTSRWWPPFALGDEHPLLREAKVAHSQAKGRATAQPAEIAEDGTTYMTDFDLIYRRVDTNVGE